MKFTKKILPFLLFLIFSNGFAQISGTSKSIYLQLDKASIAFINCKGDESLKLSKIVLHDALKIKNNELIARAYNLIGLNFQEFYDPKKAIAYYDKALSFAKKTKNDSIKSWIYGNLGSIYTYNNINQEKGIEYYKLGLGFAKKVNDPNEISYAELNIVSAYFGIQKFDEGIVYLQNAKKHIEKSGQLEAKISLATSFGNYYDYLNNNKLAEKYFLDAIELSKKNNIPLIDSNIAEVYGEFSKFYKKNNDFKNALFYLNLHNELKDSIYTDERIKNVKIEGSLIELEEYKRQIYKIEAEKYRQSRDLAESKYMGLVFLIIFIGLLLFIYSLYKNNAAKKKLNSELLTSNKELLLAKENAEIASQLKTQFISTISHELRTPLYGVIGITNIILDEHKEIVQNDHLRSLEFSANYLLALVNDMLQLNKMEEKKFILDKTIFDLSHQIKTIINSLNFIANNNGNFIKLDFDERIPRFLISDELRLSQIFVNLLSNALKFTSNGEISIKATLLSVVDEKYEIQFKIKDNGIGIAKKDQDKIFDKFVQIERKEGDYLGTGLGLTIVKRMIDLFGSEIELYSEENVGTSFTFSIIFDSDENCKEYIDEIEIEIDSDVFLHILVVEDNKINQLVTRKIIEKNFHTCVVLDNGFDAIEMIKTQDFDVILMDLNMPGITGYETTIAIRNTGFTKPIIALTAFDANEIKHKIKDAGLDDIVVKPFDTAQLFSVLKKHIPALKKMKEF